MNLYDLLEGLPLSLIFQPQSVLLQTVVIAAGTALAGAVTYLFRQVMYLAKKQSELRFEVGELKGRQEGIRDLSREVLRTVREAIESSNSSAIPSVADEILSSPDSPTS